MTWVISCMISFGIQLCFGIGSRSETARNAGWTFMRFSFARASIGDPGVDRCSQQDQAQGCSMTQHRRKKRKKHSKASVIVRKLQVIVLKAALSIPFLDLCGSCRLSSGDHVQSCQQVSTCSQDMQLD